MTQHCVSLSGSSGSIYEDRAVESVHDARDNRLGAHLKDLLVGLLVIKHRIELHVELLLDSLCDVAMGLLGAMEEELVLVLVRIEDQTRTVENANDRLLILLLLKQTVLIE